MIEALTSIDATSSLYMYGGLHIFGAVAAAVIALFVGAKSTVRLAVAQAQGKVGDSLDGVPSGESDSEDEEDELEESIKEKLAEVFKNQDEDDPDELEGLDSDDEDKGKPGGKNGVLDLFSTEIAEETGVSRFAESLEDVDIGKLLTDAQSLSRQLKGRKRR